MRSSIWEEHLSLREGPEESWGGGGTFVIIENLEEW